MCSEADHHRCAALMSTSLGNVGVVALRPSNYPSYLESGLLNMSLCPDPAAEIRRVLLTDAARFVVAIVSMAIGIGSILVQWLRRKTQDRVRLWFGMLALLYGYRGRLMYESARYFLACPAIEFQIS